MKNLFLEIFSILWNITLTSFKHSLCIIYVYNEALIPVLALFVISGNYHFKKKESSYVVMEKRVQITDFLQYFLLLVILHKTCIEHPYQNESIHPAGS